MRATLLLGLVLAVLNSGQLLHAQATNPPTTTSDQGKAGKTNSTVYSPYDVIAQEAEAKKLDPVPAGAGNSFDQFIKDQSNPDKMLDMLGDDKPPKDARDAVIIHAVEWKQSAGVYKPSVGAWAFYRIDRGKNFRQDKDLSGSPYLYDAPHVYFVDMNYFDQGFDASDPKTQSTVFSYQIKTTPRQKQNEADLSTLVSTILKVSTAGAQPQDYVQPVPQPPNVWYAVVQVKATSPVPYDLAITANLTPTDSTVPKFKCSGVASSGSQPKTPGGGDPKPTDPAPSNKCSFSKTVTHYDREYWDVSLGVAVPGVVEKKFTASTTNGVTSYKSSPTTHTDAYAFLDVYPLQGFADAPASVSWLPHFNAGLPITGQTMHRPYGGLAENIGGLTKKVKLGIPLSVFAGAVFMKQQVYASTTQTLKWDHAVKLMYGVELPISAITKYGKSGGSSSKKSSNSSSDGGGN